MTLRSVKLVIDVGMGSQLKAGRRTGQDIEKSCRIKGSHCEVITTKTSTGRRTERSRQNCYELLFGPLYDLATSITPLDCPSHCPFNFER